MTKAIKILKPPLIILAVAILLACYIHVARSANFVYTEEEPQKKEVKKKSKKVVKESPKDTSMVRMQQGIIKEDMKKQHSKLDSILKAKKK